MTCLTPSSDREHAGLILLPARASYAGDAYAFDGGLSPAQRLRAFAHARMDSRRLALERAERSPRRWMARRGLELLRMAGLV